MKIIDASGWEKRNLGCNAWEVILGRSDMGDVQRVLTALHDSKFDNAYVCVKLPVGDLRMVHALEDDGFRFLETQMYLVQTLEPAEVLDGAQEVLKRITTRVVQKDRESWEAVVAHITPGMFDTDRIALDPAFGLDIACERYRNWCRQLFDNPKSVLVVMEFDGVDAAFGVDIVSDDGTRKGVLGGVFAEFKDSGIGAALIAGATTDAHGSRCKTVLSSNNMPVFRLHQNSGRTVYRELYVLRKINKSKEMKHE